MNKSESSGYFRVLAPHSCPNLDLSYLGRCELLCGELDTHQPEHGQLQSLPQPYISHCLLALSLFIIMVVVVKSSDLNTVEKLSRHIGQDVEVHAEGRGIHLLKSKVQEILKLIHEWNDPSPSEVRRRADEELSQLLTLLQVSKLIHEGPERLLNRIDTYCLHALRKSPEKPLLLVFGRRNVFLKNVAQWAQSTHHTLFEKEQRHKSQLELLARDRFDHEILAEQVSKLLDDVEKAREKSHVEHLLYGRLSNIQQKDRDYQSIPKPFYSLSEEPMGQYCMAKVSVKLDHRQEVVQLHRTKTVHSFSGAESPPEVWANQIQQYLDWPHDLSHIAQLFGYNRCGQSYDLIFHGPLIPFEEQLQRLYNTNPLRRVELISKTTWELNLACSDFIDHLNFSGDRMAIYTFLMSLLHFNEEANKMVICGDLSQWHRKRRHDIIVESQEAVRRRLPAMFRTSVLAHLGMEKAPKHPNFSSIQDLYWDSSIKERCSMVLEFYEVLARTFEIAQAVNVPFFMRGIHVDPRIHKPCTKSWCRPMVDIWDDSVTCFLQLPEEYCSGNVPHYEPGSAMDAKFPEQLRTNLPRYLQVLTSMSPHCQHAWKGPLIDPAPLSFIPASLIWFSQASRVFSSPQFKKSGLKRSDIMYVKTHWLHSSWMIDPSELAESIPNGLSLELTSFYPHMDTNGIHLGPTKWTTADPLHRHQICESSWTIRKCFHCTANGFYWDDAAYAALDDFHSSLGMDPSSGEMAEFLGYPLLDIDDLLHTSGWMCSHPTIQDSLTTHTLTPKDFDVEWDPPISCLSSMVKDATSKINMKMRTFLQNEGFLFSHKDLDYDCPPPMYTKLVVAWIILTIQFLCKYILGLLV